MTNPSWSVVIPTYNRPDRLRAALDAIANLRKPPGDFEAVIVDDGGDADLAFLQQYDFVRPFRQENSGPATARNTGIQNARGQWVAFLDDDCCPDENWLVEFDNVLSNSPNVLVGGYTRNAFRDNAYSAASQDLIDFLYNDPAEPTFFASNNFAAARTDLLEIGGFDESYPLAAGEDRAFCRAWRDSGRTLACVPTAIVDHYHELSLTRFWRQHRNYGRGAFRFRQQPTDKSNKQPQPRESFAFYYRLVSQPLRSNIGGKRLRRTALLTLAQLATARGFFAEKAANRGR